MNYLEYLIIEFPIVERIDNSDYEGLRLTNEKGTDGVNINEGVLGDLIELFQRYKDNEVGYDVEALNETILNLYYMKNGDLQRYSLT